MSQAETYRPTGEECGQCPDLDPGSRWRPSLCRRYRVRPERYWRGRKGHLRVLDCYAEEKTRGSEVVA